MQMSADIYSNTTWLNFAIPPETSSSNFLGEHKKFDGCTMYAIHDNAGDQSCNSGLFDHDKISPCNEYIYENTYFDETLATNFNLVCDKESLVGLLGTIQIIANVFGSILGGKLGDRFGRKKTCFVAILVLAPVVTSAGFVTSYYGKTKIF